MRGEEGAGKKSPSLAAPSTPPALREVPLVQKEGSAALRWGVGVTSGRVTNGEGTWWACPCKAGGGTGGRRTHSKIVEGRGPGGGLLGGQGTGGGASGKAGEWEEEAAGLAPLRAFREGED